MLEEALRLCTEKGLLPETTLPFIEVEATKEPSHGDYASNIGMVLASQARRNPRRIAEVISSHLPDREGIIAKTEVAGPGFLNFFLRDGVWAAELAAVDELGDRYGAGNGRAGRKVQVEFVSANPTGPLHIGHARGAVVGDVIANLLAFTANDVSREYYINDAGNQMQNLGRSVYYRCRELLGEAVEFPENCYQGDYIRDLARRLIATEGDRCVKDDPDETISRLTAYAGDIILDGIREDLADFGVVFDNYFSERELYREGRVAGLLEQLKKEGYVYDDGEALWFKATAFGDEKDRVVVRKNGEPTYFAADIAYHDNKYRRGFDLLIDIWGADHHGYIPRVKAGIQALARDPETLRVVLVQLVNLLRDGRPVAMSTRAGEFVTLQEVVAEVGRDAARYNFLMRRSDSHLDFDLELAKRQSNENPVYYVQYAHARICSIVRLAGERGYAVPAYGDIDPTRLTVPEEIGLIRTIIGFPDLVEGASRHLEPHRLTFYLNELAGSFHSYYNKNKVISDDRELTTARLFLVKAVRTVLRNGLRLLGVSAPENM